MPVACVCVCVCVRGREMGRRQAASDVRTCAFSRWVYPGRPGTRAAGTCGFCLKSGPRLRFGAIVFWPPVVYRDPPAKKCLRAGPANIRARRVGKGPDPQHKLAERRLVCQRL